MLLSLTVHYRLVPFILLGAALGGCGNDDPANADGETGGTTTTTSAGSGDSAADDESSGADGEGGGADADDGTVSGCVEDADCANDNACTIGSCDDGECVDEAVVSNECRPQIEVIYPPRAATIAGTPGGQPEVVVSGQASSGAGDIVSVLVNGQEVDVDKQGRFEVPVSAQYGGNKLVIEAVDEFEESRKRVQSFLWSTDYHLPTEPNQGIATQGLGFYLAQETLDDGDRTPPANDLASILNLALASFDLSQFFDPDERIAREAGYNIYIRDLDLGSTDIRLRAIDGGLRLEASLNDIDGDLEFDCRTNACILLGGDSNGGLEVDRLGFSGNVLIMVGEGNELQVILDDVETQLDADDVDISSNNGYTNFLISIIEPFILGGLVEDLRDGLTDQIGTAVGPLLADGLNALALDTNIDFPNLADPDGSIPINLVTDFHDTDFHDGEAPPEPSPPPGGLIIQRGGAYAEQVTPYENLGVPDRAGCGVGEPLLSLPRTGALEVALTDDLLNQILFAGWRGGLLEFPLGADDIGDVGGGLVSDINVDVSGMLAPTASDCNADRVFLAHIGDLKLDASLNFLDSPMTFTAYSTMSVVIEITATDGGIALALEDVREIETELTINEDDQIGSETVVTAAFEGAIGDLLLDALGGGGLGAINLPEIDLSGQLGLPAGTATINIQLEDVQRDNGATIVSGHL